MKELVEKLWTAVAAISSVADILEAQISKETAPTLEEMRKVLAECSRNGHTAKVKEVLKKYGADKLSMLDSKYYQSCLQELEAFHEVLTHD